MKKLVLTKEAFVIGENALDYLKEMNAERAVIVTGGKSMFSTGVIDKVTELLEEGGAEVFVYSG